MTVKNINHYIFFVHALRTSLIFIAGFLTYELLKFLENEWNTIHPNNEVLHFSKRKIFHFILIFIIDLLILYLIFFLFKIHL
jgi:hypothetical protein